jgi:long-chain fatty acid transport protein
MQRVKLLVSVTLFLVAVSGFAQNTADIESLAGVKFNFGNPGARSLGMGGAFIALADDASAAEANPAGLTILRQPEVSVEGRNFKIIQGFNTSGTYLSDVNPIVSENFTAYSRRAELNFASVVYPLGNFSIAAYHHQQLNYNLFIAAGVTPLRFNVGPTGPVPPSQCGVGCTEFELVPFGSAVEMDIKTNALAMAWQSGPLSVGVAARHQRLDHSAASLRFELIGGNPVFSSASLQSADKEEDITFTAGFKYAASSRFGIGGVYKQGAEFDTSLQYVDISAGAVYDVGNPTFHVPDVYGVGIFFRPTPVLTITADAVRVNYSNLVDNVVPSVFDVNPQFFTADDVTEYHVGAEYFFQSRIPVAIRAGWWRDPAHQITYTGPLTTAEGIATRLLFPEGKDEDHLTVGVGLAWPRFQIDAAYDTSDSYKVGSLSFVARF